MVRLILKEHAPTGRICSELWFVASFFIYLATYLTNELTFHVIWIGANYILSIFINEYASAPVRQMQRICEV